MQVTRVTKKIKKKRRRGRVLYTGLLTSPEGLQWVKDFEKNPQKQSVTRSTVTVSSLQGSTVVCDYDTEAVKEVADPADYFTALLDDVYSVL